MEENEKIEPEISSINPRSEDFIPEAETNPDEPVKIQSEQTDAEISASESEQNAGLDEETKKVIKQRLEFAKINLFDGNYGIALKTLESIKADIGDDLKKHSDIYVQTNNMLHHCLAKLENYDYAGEIAKELVRLYPGAVGDPYVTLGHIAAVKGDLIQAHTWISITLLFASLPNGFLIFKPENVKTNLEAIENALKNQLKN